MLFAIIGMRPSSSFMEKVCSCFSLCNEGNVLDFVQRIPSVITSSSSPWFGYLSQVYPGYVPIPFNLSAIRLFYLSPWLPFQFSCHQKTCMCHVKMCKGWYSIKKYRTILSAISFHECLRRRMELLKRGIPKINQAHNVCVSTPNTVFYYKQYFTVQSVFYFFFANERVVATSNTWVEVTRAPFPQEGTSSLPFFYYTIAPGSGIWLNTTKTVYRNSQHDDSEAQELLTFAEQGFQTVQYTWDDDVELHPTIVWIQWATPCDAQPCGVCAPGVDLRSGWLKDMPCNCSNQFRTLNCGTDPTMSTILYSERRSVGDSPISARSV